MPAALMNVPQERRNADMKTGLDDLERRVPGKRLSTGVLRRGFRLCGTAGGRSAALTAAAPFDGTPPDAPDFSTKAVSSRCTGGRDERGTQPVTPATAVLQKAGLTHENKAYAGAGHAFFNDTGQRHNPEVRTSTEIAS